jgi:hypothetical protein
MASLVPAGLVLLGYFSLYRHLGFGAWGSGTYLDPVRQFPEYFRAALLRVPILLSALLLKLPAEIAIRSVVLRWSFALAGIAATFALGIGLYGLWRPLTQERRGSWLFLGALLSLLPVASTFPTGRLLILPSLGASVAIAALLVQGWARLPRIVTYWIVGVHLLLALLLWPLVTWAAHWALTYGNAAVASLDQVDASLADKRVVLVTVPDPFVGLYPSFMRQATGRSYPEAWWPLTLAARDQRLLRTSDRSFELQIIEGNFLTAEFEQLMRSCSLPLRAGEVISLDGLQVTVLEVDAGGPRRISFAFDRPLEDPKLMLLFWNHVPPEIGRSDLMQPRSPLGWML